MGVGETDGDEAPVFGGEDVGETAGVADAWAIAEGLPVAEGPPLVVPWPSETSSTPPTIATKSTPAAAIASR